MQRLQNQQPFRYRPAEEMLVPTMSLSMEVVKPQSSRRAFHIWDAFHSDPKYLEGSR